MSHTHDLQRRLRRLEDREEIGELVARYGLAMDNRDVDAIGELFTPDVEIRSGDGVMSVVGREEAVAMFEGRFTVLGPSNHFTHDRIITFDDSEPDRARGLVLSHAEMNRNGRAMLTAIRYEDEYRRDAARWRFRRRLLTFFYYVPVCEYADALGAGLASRNRAYDEPRAADWPERLPSWQRYYGK
ncbi:MAG: nuclear transport factor 2 family protein [Steroidobacteraceae bacterium]|nr:nuclear transport factor 2 family protein [Steroidobacteraceae bacterium]